jgi:hypothetical protein
MADRNFKRGIVIADLHAGHRIGLTPPRWHRPEYAHSGADDARYYKAAIDLWYAFTDMVDQLKPIDFLISNGDHIEGKNRRQGGTELVASDRTEQVEMAAEAIRYTEAPLIYMTYGTGYHGGVNDDWERLIADKVGAVKIADELDLDINGLIIHAKHFSSRSGIPHGKFTPIARDRLWNTIEADYGMREKADLLFRSHVHYCCDCGEPGYRIIVTPALQGRESKFGSRICNGLVHFGIIQLDVYEQGRYFWQPHVALVESQKAELLKVV